MTKNPYHEHYHISDLPIIYPEEMIATKFFCLIVLICLVFLQNTEQNEIETGKVADQFLAAKERDCMDGGEIGCLNDDECCGALYQCVTGQLANGENYNQCIFLP